MLRQTGLNSKGGTLSTQCFHSNSIFRTNPFITLFSIALSSLYLVLYICFEVERIHQF